MREVHRGARKDFKSSEKGTASSSKTPWLLQYYPVVVRDGRRVKSDGLGSISPLMRSSFQGEDVELARHVM